MTKKIDIDAYLAAIEEIEVTVGGEVYTCKLLNFKDAVELQSRMSAESTDADGILQFMTDVCEKTGLPKDKMLALPPEVFMHVIKDFFGSPPKSE
jgi:hypothetical protein